MTMSGYRSLCMISATRSWPHSQRLELVALAMGTESLAGQEVREPAGAVRRFAEGAAAVPADRHRAVGNDVGDGVENRAYGPFAHG